MNYKCHTEKNGSEFWSFNAAGVTYQNDDGSSRQKIISELPTSGCVDAVLVPYDYNGSPAYHIKLDNKTIGNVPANIAAVFEQKSACGYLMVITTAGVHGGPDKVIGDDIDDECDEDDEQHYYGVHLTVKLISPSEQNGEDVPTPQDTRRQPPRQESFERSTENAGRKKETSAEKAIRIRRLAIKIAAVAILTIWILSRIINKF